MNCWEVLEIEPTTDEREIRRAYAKKLKVTRPDDDPTGYQVLRDAFDEALRIAPYLDKLEDEVDIKEDFCEKSKSENTIDFFGDLSKNAPLEIQPYEPEDPYDESQYEFEIRDINQSGASEFTYTESDALLNEVYRIINMEGEQELEKQWNMQMTQKEMIESITHDVRTPITLIKGNIELLKEDQENVLERAEDALNGVERLELFLKKLNEFSDLMQAPKEVVSREVLDEWIKIVTSICKLKGFSLSILSYDTSNIKLDKNTISIAIQNLVNNAIENSSVGSTIFIGFYDDIDDYTIVVRDQGDGFNNDILHDLREKYVSTKMYDNNIHGLGLSIVTKILETNKGQLLLKNYDDQGNGAEVKMVFKK